jgi:hypothetical protein
VCRVLSETSRNWEMGLFSGDTPAPQPSLSDGGERTAAKGAVTSRSGYQMLKEIQLIYPVGCCAQEPESLGLWFLIIAKMGQ